MLLIMQINYDYKVFSFFVIRFRKNCFHMDLRRYGPLSIVTPSVDQSDWNDAAFRCDINRRSVI